MTQSTKEKGILKEAIDFVRSNSATFLGVGLALIGLAIGSRLLSKRIHPDLKKVLQLRRVIQKSYINALQSLQTLKIEKRILTEYGPQKESLEHPQLNMLFLVISRLKLKQMNKEKQLRNPFLPPFEDGLFISQLEPTHRLLYNKFNIFTNHLLVVTKEYEAQSNELNEADFRQSVLVLKALDGLLFFNSGPESGSSQPHKHVQIFPREALELPIVKKLIEFVKLTQKAYDFQQQPIIEFSSFNFIHGMILLKQQPSISASKRQMFNAYKRIMRQRVNSIKAAAYNIIATQEFILLIARSKERAFNDISINAVGFMGSLLFKDEDKLNKYISLKIKPSSILEDITYPKGYEIEEQQKVVKEEQQKLQQSQSQQDSHKQA